VAFDQFKKALGKVLGNGEKDLVEKTFGPVASDDRSLPGDIAEYVTTREPTSVLRRAAAVQDIAQKFGILSGGFWSFDGSKYSTHHALIHALELVGITVFPWQARLGIRGVTVLFWDIGAKRWVT
jgi:hypothetical protein